MFNAFCRSKSSSILGYPDVRWLWSIGGFLLLAIGLVAALVPVVPTSPFLVLAAACFMRASPRLESWLVEHPLLGGPIRDWRAGRGVRWRLKMAFVLMTAGGMAFALWGLSDGPLWARLSVILGGSLSAWFFLSLPTRPRE